eukprot:CAMPEP_0171797186 /NCGR_PEP_ID=MMETSP0991-20121206/69771_1 /TAXON_ID=483369 /ORGANISM="non described non described, Strain CCMP2098" /LENGTH=67 /DNA_ID=CAMNT_0012408131 /DNA_START=60 /DNA_END=260 /DNA_ORIENTATION=-
MAKESSEETQEVEANNNSTAATQMPPPKITAEGKTNKDKKATAAAKPQCSNCGINEGDAGPPDSLDS